VARLVPDFAALNPGYRPSRRTKAMTQPDIQRELEKAPYEPLLPIEKKLIGWSLGLGIVLLAVLVAVNHYLPVTALK
jgi:hypothetical protein